MIFNCNYKILNQNYSKIIDFIKNFSCIFVFVIREYPENYIKILTILQEHLIEIENTNKWPGTELLYGTANVYYYNLNDSSCQVLKNIAKDFMDWKYPYLPEDLCFIKSKNKEFLSTITHENEAYFELSEEEYISINDNFKDIFKNDTYFI